MSENYDLKMVLEKVKIKDEPGLWHKTWDDSMASFHSSDIGFLEDNYLFEANKILSLDEDALKELMIAAAVIRKDACLCRLAWHCSRLLFHSTEPVHPWSFYFPVLDEYLGEFSLLFNNIVLISGMESALRIHKKRGIPLKITLDTFSDYKLWLSDYYKRHGKWGMEQNQWLIYHFSGRLYRLGRLQYIHDSFQGDLKVYRNIRNNKVIALSGSGVRFRRDGQVDGTNDINDTEGAWVSLLVTGNTVFEGNPIMPDGHAVRDLVVLPADEWKPILSKGDTVLDMHIPEDGKMDEDLCRNSVCMAMDFFPRYFPDKPFKAFACNSWLLDCQYGGLLPAASNIVKFQREFYLYPVLGDDRDTFQRVFGKIQLDISNAPRDSKLRAAIADHVSSGGHFHNAGGFILNDDLDWGKSIYQRQPDGVFSAAGIYMKRDQF